MADITLIEVLAASGPYIAALGTGATAYFLGRKKSNAEAALIASKKAQQDAETGRYIKDTKWQTITRQGERIDDLEEKGADMEQERALFDQRIKAKNLEIAVLQEELIAAQALTAKYRKIAIMLQEQLERAHLTPFYNVRDEVVI